MKSQQVHVPSYVIPDEKELVRSHSKNQPFPIKFCHTDGLAFHDLRYTNFHMLVMIFSSCMFVCRHSQFRSADAKAIHQAALNAFTTRQVCGREMNKAVGLPPLLYNKAGCLTFIEYQGVYEVCRSPPFVLLLSELNPVSGQSHVPCRNLLRPCICIHCKHTQHFS